MVANYITKAVMNENRTKQSKNSTNLVCVAAISGAFGVKGEVKIKSFTDQPGACLSYGPLLDQKGQVILTIKKQRSVKNGFAVFTQEVDTREQAEALKGTKLYVDRDSLPTPDEDEYYYTDLIGLTVETTDGEAVGKVKAIHDFGGGDVLEIWKQGEKSWYHPFTKQAVPLVDIKEGRAVIELVEADEVKPRNEEE